MRPLLLLCLICLTFYAHAQDDYRIYHRWINNAERCFFLDHKTDSAYCYYDMAFAKFDFVFAKDCFMAAQIACYNKNEKYIPYLKKGFKNGLLPHDLKLADVFAPLIKDSIAFKKKFPDYAALRKVYLKRINVKVLRTVMQSAIADQQEKLDPYEIYGPKLTSRIRNISALINSVGFPGDKLVGLTQPHLMHELGYENEDYPWGLTRPEMYDNISQYMLFPLLVHYPCFYQLFSANKWEQMIIKGQVHPSDVAMLYDNMFRVFPLITRKLGEEVFGCSFQYPSGCYRKNSFVEYWRATSDRHIIDSMRTALFINTLVVDSAKHAFGDKHGFDTAFGFFDCR